MVPWVLDVCIKEKRGSEGEELGVWKKEEEEERKRRGWRRGGVSLT